MLFRRARLLQHLDRLNDWIAARGESTPNSADLRRKAIELRRAVAKLDMPGVRKQGHAQRTLSYMSLVRQNKKT